MWMSRHAPIQVRFDRSTVAAAVWPVAGSHTPPVTIEVGRVTKWHSKRRWKRAAITSTPPHALRSLPGRHTRP